MYITTTHSKGRSKDYTSTLLRESYREDGKVKNRTIANLSHCKPNEIEAIKLALAHKDDPTGLVSLKDQVQLEQGLVFLSTLSAMTLTVPNMGVELHKIPRPRPDATRLLDLAGVRLPEAIPNRNLGVVTRTKLISRRKST